MLPTIARPRTAGARHGIRPVALLTLLMLAAVMGAGRGPAAFITHAPAARATAGPMVRITAAEIAVTPPPPGGSTRPRVTLHVAVTDTSGLPVRGLKEDAFQVAEDGKPVQRVAVQGGMNAAEPVAFVLALDTSGSMGEFAGQPLRDLKAAALAFIDALPQQDQTAVFGFGGRVPDGIGFAPDRDAIRGAITGLTALGATPLWDAVYAAVDMASTAQTTGRRAVLVMTDGRDEDANGGPGSHMKVDDIINLARDRHVPVYAVGLGQVQAGDLDRIAKTTGGLFLAAPTSDRLLAAFAEVGDTFRQEYTVAFDGEPRPAAGERDYTLAVNTGGERGVDGRRAIVDATISPHVLVSWVNPRDGQEVRGGVRLEAEVIPATSVREVRFLVGTDVIGVLQQAPFAVTWDGKSQTNGVKLLTVEATGQDGQTETAEVRVTFDASSGNLGPAVGVAGMIAVVAAVSGAALLGASRRGRRAAPDGSAPDALPGPATGAVMSWLVERAPDGGIAFQWPLPEGETRIGRAVDPPHILLGDQDVSRLHAVVRREGAVAVFEDRAPRNPTRLNGTPLRGPWTLHDGDVLQVGGVRLEYRNGRVSTPSEVSGRPGRPSEGYEEDRS